MCLITPLQISILHTLPYMYYCPPSLPTSLTQTPIHQIPAFTVNMEQLGHVAQEVGLDNQHYQCNACTRPIGLC